MNKSRIIPLVVIIVLLALAGGYFIGKRDNPAGSASDASPVSQVAATRKVLYWKAPMDPNFHSDKPGKSPMGMDLVPVYADGSNGTESSDVKISPDMVNNLGVRTAEAKQGALARQLQLVGYVGYDEDTIRSVNTRADGWIEKLAVKSVGDTVHAGQLLYALFSPKLATAEREYLVALASGSASLISASGQRLRALGFSAAQIGHLKRTRKVSDRVARYAGSAGVVTSLGVREGGYVMPATQVMQLADLSTVWVLVEVDESQASLLHVGQKAEARFAAFPGRQWQGVIDHVYPDLSTMTRTVKARVRLDNADRRLQPNMYAHVTIEAAPHEGPTGQREVVYIPSLALIRTGHSQRVIVALGGGRFDICPVEAGLTDGNKVAILKGLRAGQRVVTSAQFLIDSEANVDAAALNYGSANPGCSAPPSSPSASLQSPARSADREPDGKAVLVEPVGTSSVSPPADAPRGDSSSGGTRSRP